MSTLPPAPIGPDDDALLQRFQPVFDRIAQGAVQRERDRTLPEEALGWLKAAGFGAVRVPVESGGAGASLVQLVRLFIALAEADSNLTQTLRGHFAFVEDRLNAPDSPHRTAWLQRFAQGELVGNAWTEVGDARLGELNTRVSAAGDGSWRLDGRKFYSTGSLFADWIDVLARREDGSDVIAVVRTRQPGVTQHDDWDGFGQRTTGSGSAVFDGARVEAADVIDFAARFKYQTAFYQLNLLAVLAGTGRAIVRDAAHHVRERQRVYSHGNAPRTRDDVQVLQVIGDIAARVYAAEAATLHAAGRAQQAYELRGRNDAAERQANVAAEIESAQAQVVVADLVLRSATDLFNALGASAVRIDAQLDRHWRNARTAASHNPLIYKSRIVGDWVVNGKEPPFLWQIGVGSPPPTA